MFLVLKTSQANTTGLPGPPAADMSLRGSNGKPRSRLPFQEPTKPATLSQSKLLLLLTVLAKSANLAKPKIR